MKTSNNTGNVHLIERTKKIYIYLEVSAATSKERKVTKANTELKNIWRQNFPLKQKFVRLTSHLDPTASSYKVFVLLWLLTAQGGLQ